MKESIYISFHMYGNGSYKNTILRLLTKVFSWNNMRNVVYQHCFQNKDFIRNEVPLGWVFFVVEERDVVISLSFRSSLSIHRSIITNFLMTSVRRQPYEKVEPFNQIQNTLQRIFLIIFYNHQKLKWSNFELILCSWEQ